MIMFTVQKKGKQKEKTMSLTWLTLMQLSCLVKCKKKYSKQWKKRWIIDSIVIFIFQLESRKCQENYSKNKILKKLNNIGKEMRLNFLKLN